MSEWLKPEDFDHDWCSAGRRVEVRLEGKTLPGTIFLDVFDDGEGNESYAITVEVDPKARLYGLHEFTFIRYAD